MKPVFQACREIANREVRPMHYTFLAREALALFGYSVVDVNWQRQIEDIREKLLLKGGFGFGYLPRPYCLAYLKEWVNRHVLFNPYSPIEINPSLQSSLRAAEQVGLRKYIDKTNAPKPIIVRGRSRGLLIESHVRHWFESHWPEYTRPPDNENQLDMPCDHDFKLCLNGRIFKVDVAGPRANGQYGRPLGGGKSATDIHILASLDTNTILVHGFVYHDEYKESLSVWEAHPIACLVFRLNCLKASLDYGLFI